MPTTIQDIASEAGLEILNRSDNVGRAFALKAATRAYRTICAAVPFSGLQTLSDEIPTVANQAEYNLDALITSPELQGIINIRYTMASGTKRRLTRDDTRTFDAVGTSVSTPSPSLYSRFGSTIELFQPPDSANDTFRIRYWARPIISTDDPGAAQLVTPVEWEELFIWETVYRLYNYLEEFEKAAMLMQTSFMPRQRSPSKVAMHEIGIISRLWNDLLQTIPAREFVDEDFGINPLSRSYTRQ